jgi:hypothetical protein
MLQLFRYGCCKSRSGDIAHVVIVLEACCKGMFQVFQMFQKYMSSVFSGRMLHMCLSGCCICFIHTLHMFYLDVAYGYNNFQVFQLSSDYFRPIESVVFFFTFRFLV